MSEEKKTTETRNRAKITEIPKKDKKLTDAEQKQVKGGSGIRPSKNPDSYDQD